MKIIIITILLISSLDIFSFETNLIIEDIKDFKIGSEFNEFKFNKSDFLPDGIGNGPSIIKFDDRKNIFYLVDGSNSRVCIYDLNFNQIDEIRYDENLYLRYPHDMQINGNGFILFQKYGYITFLDWNGNVVWHIVVSGKHIGEELENNNFYYDESNKLLFFYLYGEDIACFSELSSNGYKYKITKGKDDINKLLESKGVENIYISDEIRLYVHEILYDKEYYAYHSIKKDKYVEDLIYIGKINSISYWKDIYNYLMIYNKEGKFVAGDFFDEQDIFGRTIMSGIHPSGDLLFMNYDDDKVVLKRVVNTWDPEFREVWYKDHPDYP